MPAAAFTTRYEQIFLHFFLYQFSHDETGPGNLQVQVSINKNTFIRTMHGFLLRPACQNPPQCQDSKQCLIFQTSLSYWPFSFFQVGLIVKDLHNCAHIVERVVGCERLHLPKYSVLRSDLKQTMRFFTIFFFNFKVTAILASKFYLSSLQSFSMMYCSTLCLFIFSLLFPSGFWVHAECYYPDKSVVPNYQPCNPKQVNETTACCDLSNSVCSTEGYYFGSVGFLYRAGCTDPHPNVFKYSRS